MSQISNHKWSIIGFASDFGASKRGAKDGAKVLRDHGLLRALADLNVSHTDCGDVSADTVPSDILSKANFTPEELKCNFPREVYGAAFALREAVERALNAGGTPLVLGGDHSLSIGSVAGVSRHYQRKGERIGLIWVDTHPDLNTPLTSASGNIHGMPVAALAGLMPGAYSGLGGDQPSIDPKNIAYIGLRDVDTGEREFIKRLSIPAFSMTEVDRWGIGHSVERAIEVACNGTAGFVLSFDLDVCDPSLAPGTGTPKRGGLTYRESHLVIELAAASGKMKSFELVEFNPALDKENQTVELAISLVESAVGKSIL